MENKSRKKDQMFIRNLSAGDEPTVLRTIVEIRSSGNPRLIPALVRTFAETRSKSVRNEILILLMDLKVQEAVPPLVEAIFQISNPEQRRDLISTCWQSGLNFSAHLTPFVESLLNDDYATALEDFSVIENNLHRLNTDQIRGLQETLKEGIAHIREEVRPLANQLEILLSDISE